MTEDKKEIVQDVIDRLLYCSDYKSKLIEFNAQFNPNTKCDYTTDVKKFLFN